MPSEQADAAELTAITFVNRFAVHAPPEEFEQVFAETSAFMARQPGFLDHTLVRQIDRADAYVNIARWADEESFRAALLHPDFAPHATALRALSTSEHALYRTRQRGHG
jgi:heme-degrading monooxygenase HmoA